MKKIFLLFLFFCGFNAFADPINIKDEDWNVHFQNTLIYQGYAGYSAKYSASDTSLSPKRQAKYTDSATIFLGYKLWQNGELYYNPELMKGIPLSHTFGVSNFVNGDAQKAGSYRGKAYNARLFLRQTFNLGGESERVESDQNVLAKRRDISRITITAGKFATTDIFDNNSYSHNPRTQFLNWGIMDSAAWDYPEDMFSYDQGVAIDFNQKNWALRYGAFIEPYTANGKRFAEHGTESLGNVLELEERYSILEKAGITRFLTFLNRARMGNFGQAVDTHNATGEDVTTALRNNREYGRKKYGFAINSEQKITDNLGTFMRLSWNNGATEDWCFTQSDESLALGLSLKGNSWNRPEDTLGIAGVISGTSGKQQQFLAAGGRGFVIGDGALRYGREEIIETYYSYKLLKYAALSPDYQYVRNPAFNKDRGPVHIFAGRLHIEI